MVVGDFGGAVIGTLRSTLCIATRQGARRARPRAQPVRGKGNGLAPSEALKRRAELVRLIERAERDLLEVEEAIERQPNRVGRVK